MSSFFMTESVLNKLQHENNSIDHMINICKMKLEGTNWQEQIKIICTNQSERR